MPRSVSWPHSPDGGRGGGGEGRGSDRGKERKGGAAWDVAPGERARRREREGPEVMRWREVIV